MDTPQKSGFLKGEADCWYERNKSKLGQFDPVSHILDISDVKPTAVLEVGCADGWRVERLRQRYRCISWGIDPSFEATAIPTHSLCLRRGTADDLRYWPAGFFDLVIYGFCLYLCDPSLHLAIAAEGDRVLKDGGHIVVHDFMTLRPFRRRYTHRRGLYAYHFDPAALWLGHPGYHRLSRVQGQDEDHVTLLVKDLRNAFPIEEE